MTGLTTQKILIVDDVSSVRNFLRQTLSHLGAREMDEVGSGQACIESFKRAQHDIIFLDIELPDMNGIKLLTALKKVKSDVNVIMISAHSSVDNVKEAMTNGAKGFIVKPFSPKKISSVLSKIVD